MLPRKQGLQYVPAGLTSRSPALTNAAAAWTSSVSIHARIRSRQVAAGRELEVSQGTLPPTDTVRELVGMSSFRLPRAPPTWQNIAGASPAMAAVACACNQQLICCRSSATMPSVLN